MTAAPSNTQPHAGDSLRLGPNEPVCNTTLLLDHFKAQLDSYEPIPTQMTRHVAALFLPNTFVGGDI